jgi:hypothetical protein
LPVESKVTENGTRLDPLTGFSVKVVALMVPEAIGRLKVAVISLPLLGTPVVLVVTNWLPLVGSDIVTVGIVGPEATEHTPPGMIAPDAPGMPPTPPPPRIGSWPPHPAANAASSNAINHISGLVTLSNLFIFFSFIKSELKKTSVQSTDPLLVLVLVRYAITSGCLC